MIKFIYDILQGLIKYYIKRFLGISLRRKNKEIGIHLIFLEVPFSPSLSFLKQSFSLASKPTMYSLVYSLESLLWTSALGSYYANLVLN